MQSKKKKYFRKRKKIPLVEKAILDTLKYRAVFNYPMSFYQLSNYLVTKKKVASEALETALINLEKKKKIKVKEKKYYLSGIKIVSWDERFNSSQELIEKANKLAQILEKIPWITFIGVTGSVAANNATKDDDIDILIITKPKRLWLTRGFVFLILKILGELRTDVNSKKKFCPNIFLDESNSGWSKSKRNLYVAHEIAMIYPALDREEAYFKFIKSNDWVFNHLRNVKPDSYESKLKYKMGFSFFNIFESLAFETQTAYMKNKMTTEVIKKDFIHFNRDDSTEKVLGNYKRTKI